MLYTLNPQLMLNSGLTRPFTCIAPEGTVLNPSFPAAVGMRSLTCARLRSLIFGAFSLAVPERMPAAPAGSSSIVNVMTTDEKSHRSVIAAINPVVGGGGGMPHRDGPNGSGADSAYLKNTPIEITETEVPIQFVRYGLLPDSGGAGRWRGGLATVMEFKVFAPNTRITVRNRDRSHFRPWGTLGGLSAETSNFIINPGAANERILGNTDIAIAEPGDVIHIHSPGGGGRGSPLEREPERVLLDVARGYVSEAMAKARYGVVIAAGAVDADATTALRAQMQQSAHSDAFPFRTRAGRLRKRLACAELRRADPAACGPAGALALLHQDEDLRRDPRHAERAGCRESLRLGPARLSAGAGHPPRGGVEPTLPSPREAGQT